MELIDGHAPEIRRTADRIQTGFRALAAAFPETVEAAHGRGHLAGLKFRRLDEAKAFHRRLHEAGLWTRLHAYHEGHRTILTKLGLLADESVAGFVIGRFHELLRNTRS
jgi:acetylornithine/succinyldiaminopimelate/putrescine aminotransferase